MGYREVGDVESYLSYLWVILVVISFKVGPTIYKWSYIPYKWSYKRVTGVISPYL